MSVNKLRVFGKLTILPKHINVFCSNIKVIHNIVKYIKYKAKNNIVWRLFIVMTHNGITSLRHLAKTVENCKFCYFFTHICIQKAMSTPNKQRYILRYDQLCNNEDIY